MTDETIFCIDDFERLARGGIQDETFQDYLYGGSGEGECHQRNIDSLKKILLAPRACAGITKRDLSKKMLGKTLSCPIGFAPTPARGWLYRGAEKCCMELACEEGASNCLTIFSASKMEEVVKGIPENEGVKLICTGFLGTEEHQMEVMERVEKAGLDGIVLNLDRAVPGRLRSEAGGPIKSAIMKKIGLPNLPKDLFQAYIKNENVDRTVFGDGCDTWEQVKWWKANSKLPLIIKGIARASDAQEAINAGVDAIWISNHGGRQLSDCPATIDLLKKIAPVVKGTGVELYIDGGFRTGSDILKAIALGADVVFLGRPVLSALACAGDDALREMLKILKKELDIAMGLCGISSLSQADESLLWYPKKK